MLASQRVMLAVSCILFLGLLKHLFDETAANAIVSYLEHAAVANNKSRTNPFSNSSLLTSSSSFDPADQKASPDHGTPATSSVFCQRLHASGLSDVAIILRTGSTEIYQKLPIHLSTTFACLTFKLDFLIYSDVAQSFGDSIKVFGALALVSNEARANHTDFAEYEKLNEHVRLGGDAADLRGEGNRAWRLDKWKFLPMISDASAAFHGRKKWFLFIEADTYVSLSNLVIWLSHLDASQAVYAGAQVVIDKTEFGHGGSGFILSAPAAKALRETHLRDRLRWEGVIGADCYGDKVMAEVLLAAEPPIRLLRAFPLIQGETLESLDWSSTHWCRPAVTWHHVNTAGIDKLWQFEKHFFSHQNQTNQSPILFKDYFKSFILPRLRAANFTLPAWDNLSNDWSFSSTPASVSSPGSPDEYNIAAETAWACKTFCEKTEECVQWSYRRGSCKANKVVRFGWSLKSRPELGSAEDRIQAVDGQETEGTVAGWVDGRVEEYVQKMEACEEDKFWVTKNDWNWSG